mmetsp:Transcript_29253/g.56689  ORF Transcript_29253/g.56689 Transcript_29253/m.56689 type:complete len:326 (+) Transcript_29253:4455-5432(+)
MQSRMRACRLSGMKRGAPFWHAPQSHSVKTRLVLRLVDHLACGNPRHHAAQLLARFFDLVLVIDAARRFERGLTHGVFKHEVAHELAVLNVGQNRLHLGLGLVIGQDARAGDIFAILSRIGDRVVHVGDAAFIDQVDDQFDLVQTLEIGHFGGIARLDKGLKAHADQLDQATAQNGLLTKEVCFALFAEVGFNDARATATDGGAVGQTDLQRAAGGILVHSHKTRHAAAFDILATHGVTRAFGGHHDHVDARFGLDQAKMHVQAVGKSDGSPFADIVMYVFLVGFRLKFIGHCEHDQIGPGRRFGDAHSLQALAFGLSDGGRAFA